MQKKKKKKKKKRQAQVREKEYPSVKKRKKIPLWKRLVLTELRAGVQILNKEVAVKPKFVIHNVSNEVSFY